jgi:hypothetical protein
MGLPRAAAPLFSALNPARARASPGKPTIPPTLPSPPLRGAALALAAFVPRPLPEPAHFRYWVDFQALSSPESAALAERALQMLGGVRTGAARRLGGGG